MSFPRTIGGFAGAACVVVLALQASAQQALTLDETQRLALGRSQQLVANDAAAAAVRDLRVSAGQLPDPVLRVGVENVPLSGPARLSLSRDDMTMQRIGVMRELTSSDKRRLREERVQSDVIACGRSACRQHRRSSASRPWRGSSAATRRSWRS